MGPIYIIMCIILLTFRFRGFGTREEPHVEALGTLTAQTLLEVMGNLIGIDEMTVHTLGNIAGSHAVKSVGIDE
jgi:hypothetical protein